jgi:hypothetical protein
LAIFSHYLIEIRRSADDSLARTVTDLAEPRYTYKLADNAADHAGVPSRTFKVYLFRVDDVGTRSEPQLQTITNPAPATPSVVITPALGGFQITASPGGAGTDHAGLKVWLSVSSGFTPAPANLYYQGAGTEIFVPSSDGTPQFIVAALYDTLSDEDLNSSAEYEGSPLLSTTQVVDARQVALDALAAVAQEAVDRGLAVTAAATTARREGAGIAQRTDARLAAALAMAQSESLRSLSENTRIEQLVIGVQANLDAGLASAETTYLAAVDLESAVALIDLSTNVAFSTAQDDIVAAQADATQAIGSIAELDRATSRAAQRLSARIAASLAQTSSEVLASATATQSVVQKVDTLTATVAGNRAEVIADYLATVDLEGAVALIDLTTNAVFNTALGDIVTADGIADSAQADATSALASIATANRATSRAVQALSARIAASLASASSEVLASATATQSIGQKVDTVSASVDGIDALVSVMSTALVDLTDPANPVMLAKYGIELDVDGSITGIYGFNDGTSSGWVFAADSFEFKTASGTVTPFSITGDTVTMLNVEVDTLTANIITATEIDSAFALLTRGAGPPSATSQRIYQDTGNGVAWLDNGTDVFRLSKDANSGTLGAINASAGKSYSSTTAQIVAKVAFSSASALDELQIIGVESDYQSPPANAGTTRGQWSVYLSDTSLAVGQDMGSSTTETRIWAGADTGITFFQAGGDPVEIGGDDAGDAGGFSKYVGTILAGNVYAYLCISVSSGDTIHLGSGTKLSVVLK